MAEFAPRYNPLKGCLVVTLAAALFVTAVVLAFDYMCLNRLAYNLPVYPGAEVVYAQHSFFNRFGFGATLMELYSPDSTSAVSAWYARELGVALREELQGVRQGPPAWRGEWEVNPAETGSGSQIFLSASCP